MVHVDPDGIIAQTPVRVFLVGIAQAEVVIHPVALPANSKVNCRQLPFHIKIDRDQLAHLLRPAQQVKVDHDLFVAVHILGGFAQRALDLPVAQVFFGQLPDLLIADAPVDLHRHIGILPGVMGQGMPLFLIERGQITLCRILQINDPAGVARKTLRLCRHVKTAQIIGRVRR